MIQIVGLRKVIILVLLVAANTALAAVTYLYVQPESGKLDRQLRSIKSQVAQKREDTDRLRNEFEEVQEKKVYFESLQASGFLSDQNRLDARRRIMDIQQFTKVLRAGYNINSASILRNKTTDEIGYVVLSSAIDVEVEALDDIDFYNFMYLMENAFPGHIAVTSVRLQRATDLSEVSLRQIGSGLSMTLVKGNVKFIWRTIVPEADVQPSGEFGARGF